MTLDRRPALLALTLATAVLSAAGAASAAAPVTERVIHGPLTGLAPSGPVREPPTAAATVAALDSDHPAADLRAYRRAGFVRAALQRFGDGRSTFGFSLAIETRSATAARREVARDQAIVRGDAARNDGMATGVLVTLRRIPGSLAFVERFTDGGHRLRFTGVIFRQGAFAYTIVAGGPDRRISGRRLFDAAASLYDANAAGDRG